MHHFKQLWSYKDILCSLKYLMHKGITYKYIKTCFISKNIDILRTWKSLRHKKLVFITYIIYTKDMHMTSHIFKTTLLITQNLLYRENHVTLEICLPIKYGLQQENLSSVLVNNKGADQSEHRRSLISAFVIRLLYLNLLLGLANWRQNANR